MITQKKNHFQAQQSEIDLLNQRAQEILRQADQHNSQIIESKNTELNREWSDLLNNFENRRETLTTLAERWEEFEKQLHLFETTLIRLEERSKHVDPIVRSRRQLEDTKNAIQVIIHLLLF